MASYDAGKSEVVAWIRANFDTEAKILDVGACDGKWRDLLPEFLNMDAVEIWLPNVNNHRLASKYRAVYNEDIHGFDYPEKYDLVIFGDVIEHLNVRHAKAVLRYAKEHSGVQIVGVPWLYTQGPIDGNEFERHRQDDLTMEVFNERYPGFHILQNEPEWDYCYFVRGRKND